MNKFFSLESPLVQGLSVAADYIMLNFLFLLCSVPIVTMGAAKTALYRVMFDMAEQKGNTFKRYFKAFASELKTITPIHLLKLAIYGLLVWELVVMSENSVSFLAQTTLRSPVAVVLLLTILVVGMVFSSIPAQVAVFNATRREYLKNGIYIALTRFTRCLPVALMDLLPILLILWNPYYFFIVGPVFVFFYFSVTTNLSMRLFKKPFDFYAENANQ